MVNICSEATHFYKAIKHFLISHGPCKMIWWVAFGPRALSLTLNWPYVRCSVVVFKVIEKKQQLFVCVSSQNDCPDLTERQLISLLEECVLTESCCHDHDPNDFMQEDVWKKKKKKKRHGTFLYLKTLAKIILTKLRILQHNQELIFTSYNLF